MTARGGGGAPSRGDARLLARFGPAPRRWLCLAAVAVEVAAAVAVVVAEATGPRLG